MFAPKTKSQSSSVLTFCGSLKFAVILLSVLAIFSAAGTILESRLNAAVARESIYAAWWFDVWLLLLCVNLFCAAAVRYPWKSYQTGFVVTHAGIITLLIGGLIDRHRGLEGFLHLYRGDTPTNLMELHEQELRLYDMESGLAPGITRLNLEVVAFKRNLNLPLKTPSAEIVAHMIDAGDIELETSVALPDPNGRPSLQWVIEAPMMGRHDQWIQLGEERNLGPASVSFTRGTAPDIAEKIAPAPKMELRLERHFQFQKMHDALPPQIISGDKSARSEVASRLFLDVENKPQLELTYHQKQFTFDVIAERGKTLLLKDLESHSLIIRDYYPNFKMKANGMPDTIDDKPENPAILFEINGPEEESRDAEQESGNPHGRSAPAGDPEANRIVFYLGEDNSLSYHIKSRKGGEKSGRIELNAPTPVDWAPNATFTLLDFHPKARLQPVWRRAAEGAHAMSKQARRGVKLRIEMSGETQELWLAQSSAQSNLGASYRYTIGGKQLGLTLANKLVQLPFTINLMKFSAPHQPGEPTTSKFMEFESVLSFEGRIDQVTLRPDSSIPESPQAKPFLSPMNKFVLVGAVTKEQPQQITLESAHGAELIVPRAEIQQLDINTHRIKMNYPTSYPVTWHGPWFGTSFKFSQASHDMPRNKNYSGVQVLIDPGWFFKWVGSLMICLGIFTMFYLKPYFIGRRQHKQKIAAAEQPIPVLKS